MTADKPLHLVPKLRFAEFVDEPPWECSPLKKLAKRITQRNTQGTDLRVLTNSAEHGVINQWEYFDRDIATNADNYYIVETGDYVYNPRCSSTAPVGPISKNQIGTGLTSPIYTVFRFESDPNDFFAHYFKSAHWHGYLRRVSNKGARHDRMAITNDDLMQMPVPTPTPHEQQKIADCLGSLDDLIAAEVRKLDALRQYKQGLMQQLFPQPGETAPRLRFPGFQRAGDWKRDQIGNIASITKGKRVSKADITNGGATPCIRYAELYTHYREVIHEVVSRTNVPNDDLVLSQAEDVIVPASGETKVDIARAACVLPGRVALGSDLNILRSSLYGPFFSYLLNSPLRHMIARVSQGDTVAHLYPKQLSQVQLAYPSRPEQQKIAECLGALDDQIAAEGRKLGTLRQHKKGLMQQLFPSPEGIRK